MTRLLLTRLLYRTSSTVVYAFSRHREQNHLRQQNEDPHVVNPLTAEHNGAEAAMYVAHNGGLELAGMNRELAWYHPEFD